MYTGCDATHCMIKFFAMHSKCLRSSDPLDYCTGLRAGIGITSNTVFYVLSNYITRLMLRSEPPVRRFDLDGWRADLLEPPVASSTLMRLAPS